MSDGEKKAELETQEAEKENHPPFTQQERWIYECRLNANTAKAVLAKQKAEKGWGGAVEYMGKNFNVCEHVCFYLEAIPPLTREEEVYHRLLILERRFETMREEMIAMRVRFITRRD